MSKKAIRYAALVKERGNLVGDAPNYTTHRRWREADTTRMKLAHIRFGKETSMPQS